ncbi:hypothetical protein QFZ84_005323 [Pseudomonas fluorescens]
MIVALEPGLARVGKTSLTIKVPQGLQATPAA